MRGAGLGWAVSLALLLGGCSRPSLADADMLAYELSLAVSPSGSFAAWHGGPGKGSAIYVQRVDATGQLTGTPMRVSDGKGLAYEPDLVPAGERLALAWYEKDPATEKLTAQLAMIDRDGRIAWQTRLGEHSRNARNPVVRVMGDDIHVAWIEQYAQKTPGNSAEVWHQSFSLAGSPNGPPRKIGEANRDTWNLNAAVTGDRFIVTFDAALNTKAHELQMLEVMGDEVRHVRLSADDGKASLYPDLQIGPAGTAALTWFDEKDGNKEVYLQIAPLDALGAARGPAPMRITHDAGDSIGAYVAWNGPTLGLAWSDEANGRRELFVQMFDATGKALGPRQQRGKSSGRASVPAIRASGAGFLVAWNDYVARGTGDHEPIRASRVRLDRVPIAP